MIHPASLFVRYALESLSTKEEVTYLLSCTEEGIPFEASVSGLKILNGSDALVARYRYCGFLVKLLSTLAVFMPFTHVLTSVNLITSDYIRVTL